LVGVEQWAEIRRMRFVVGLSIKEIARRTGRDRNTVRSAIRADRPPRYERRPVPSKLDPFKDEIHRLLRQDPKLPGQRVRELLAPLGYAGGKTIVDDYVREVRPLFAPPPRSFHRTVYQPGELCQFDLWEPRGEIPVGHGQTRRGSLSKVDELRSTCAARSAPRGCPLTLLCGGWRCPRDVDPESLIDRATMGHRGSRGWARRRRR
jgi:hypothetical protein